MTVKCESKVTLREGEERLKTIYQISKERGGFSNATHNSLKDPTMKSLMEKNEITENDFLLCSSSNS